MSPKGRGYGVTPAELVRRLTDAVSKESKYSIAKKTGLAWSVIQGLLKGDREPSSSTLLKLSNYFGVSVPVLRGEMNAKRESNEDVELNLKILKDMLAIYSIAPEDLKESIQIVLMHYREEVLETAKLHVSKISNKNIKAAEKLVTEVDKLLYPKL